METVPKTTIGSEILETGSNFASLPVSTFSGHVCLFSRRYPFPFSFLYDIIFWLCVRHHHNTKNNVITIDDAEIISLLNWLTYMSPKILDTEIMETFPVFLCLDAVITSNKKLKVKQI